MDRREFLQGVSLTALAMAAGSASARVMDSSATPPNSFGRRLPLIFCIGAAGCTVACALFDARGADIGNRYWSMWAPLPPDMDDIDAAEWCAETYPFSAANASHVYLVTRLGEKSGNLLAPVTVVWRERGVPVEILAVYPDASASLETWDVAVSQLHAAKLSGASGMHRLDIDDPVSGIDRLFAGRATKFTGHGAWPVLTDNQAT